MNDMIALTESTHEALVDSLLMAKPLGVSHHAVLQLIDKNIDAFKSLGQLAFQMRVVSKKGAGQATRYALLTEDQAFFLLALSRNTKRVVKLKLILVQAFSRFRHEQQSSTDYLPFYHNFHNAIKALVEYAHANGSNTKESIFHLSYNKLINKSCGIESGQRQNIDVNSRVNITNATAAVIATIKQGIDSGVDYHDIFQQAKVSIAAAIYKDEHKALGD